MRWTGVLECWRLAINKGTLLMSLGYPRALSPGCGTNSKWLEMSGPRRRSGTFNNSSPGPFNCPSGQAPPLEHYDLQNNFQNATGVQVSTQTVRNWLLDAGLRSWRPAICIPLTQRHFEECLQWAQTHVTWTVNDWTPVLFTDESMLCVDFTDRRTRVWRSPNERLAPACIAKHDRFGGVSVMVWVGISTQGKTNPTHHWHWQQKGMSMKS
jgi:hypothetical protein